MLTRYIALVSETKEIEFSELTAVAAALQKQASRDFEPIWHVRANVGAYAKLEDVPLDYWPIIVKSELERDEAAGYHDDELGEPCALVRLTDDWSVTASHEMLEMLADPWGRHLVAGPSPRSPGQRVKFLVEVCDPCPEELYEVNGVVVSDFYTPHFFDPVATPSVRYSFTGAITEPRQVLKGGYLTWHDPAARTWWHRSWFDGHQPEDKQIPEPKIVKGNIRAAIDRQLTPQRERSKSDSRSRATKKEEPQPAFTNRASDIRNAFRRRAET